MSRFSQSNLKAVDEVISQTIAGIVCENDAARILFENGKVLILEDQGQHGCEKRYMTTDDDIKYLVGARLVDVELGDVSEDNPDKGDVHEIQFLIVKTTKGNATFVTHNEHNGCYGGFDIEARIL